ncbi:hypothetical protein WEI85_46340 [Actinomycetes bacterium KLBMP 9797]
MPPLTGQADPDEHDHHAGDDPEAELAQPAPRALVDALIDAAKQ